MQENALFSGKIYTPDTNFTRSPRDSRDKSQLWVGKQWFAMVCNDGMHAKCSQAVKQTRRLGCAVELDLCLGCKRKVCKRKECRRKGVREKSNRKGVKEKCTRKCVRGKGV